MKGEPLRLAVVIRDAPAKVWAGLQGAKDAPLQVRRGEGGDYRFELDVRCDLSGERPSFLGPHTRGAREDRFVYVAWGRQVGQPDTETNRRAKVRLNTIDVATARSAMEACKPLTLEMAGTAKDGGPTCATFRPLSDWRL